VKIEPSLRITVNDGVIELQNLEEERMSVHLNNDLLKSLEGNIDSDTQKKLADAKIWIEHYTKRQDLLKRCGEYIIKKQRLFFVEGQEYILPCLQKDMALDLEVSESTISRIVRTKYIETSYGVILFKNLCQRSIYGKTKQQVKLLIEYYCQRYPKLSDKKLSNLLKEIGLPIARRTVTKYRHEIDQNSSYFRKR
jgi:RNA polymerase sigma-54 factor